MRSTTEIPVGSGAGDRYLAFVAAARGWAILLVIATHSASGLYLPPLVKAIIDCGQFGVHLFFIASAFTLCHSAQSRAQSGPSGYGSFFIRRFFRIAPMYYFGLVLYWITRSTVESTLTPVRYTLSSVMANLVFVHGWFPETHNYVVPGGWSIGTEWCFYLLFPFLLSYFVSMKHTVALIGFSLLLAALFQQYLWQSLDNGIYTFRYFVPVNHVPVFLLGGVAFGIWRSRRQPLYDLLQPKLSRLFCAIASLCLLLSALTMLERTVFVWLASFVAGLGSVLFFVLLATSRSRLFINAALTRIGELSFSLYVTHFLFAWWLVPPVVESIIGPPRPSLRYWLIRYGATFALTLAGSVAISECTFAAIERPFQKLGSSLIRKYRFA